MRVSHDIEITPKSVVLDGKQIEVSETGERLLVELYRRYAGDYPKFYKMDTLSRLGFIAAEILLKIEPVEAVILGNRSASIKNDRDYLKTITDGNYYPSPALFVYTLPNIVTGEVAIRHHIQGETSFYVLDKQEDLEQIIQSTLNSVPSPILGGWCECSDKDEFNAKLQIIWNN
jgi:3-oxoacyl-[acyl-carrier-protein] synthase-1